MTVAAFDVHLWVGDDCGEQMNGHLYSYSEGGPWAALLKQAHGSPSQAHGSNLLILPSGEVLCTWSSGVEGEDDFAIVSAQT